MDYNIYENLESIIQSDEDKSITPCPFCNAEFYFQHPYNGCLLEGFIIVGEILEKWEKRPREKFLKNELMDALDLKKGKGPTSLEMIVSDRNRLQKVIQDILDTVIDYRNDWRFADLTKYYFPEIKGKILKMLQSIIDMVNKE